MKQHSVAVVGAGWAGLAAAVTLAEENIAVHVYESARQTGGRARSVIFNQHSVDNGQHLFLGAYKDTLALLKILGIDADSVFLRQPLSLVSLRADGSQLSLKAPRLPAPLHLLWALLTARGLSLQDRMRAIQFGLKLKYGLLRQKQDTSLTELLKRHKQSQYLCESLWEPLCIAIMNTPAKQASAEIFVRVLEDAFLLRQSDADLLIATQDLSPLLAEPAVSFIEQQQGHVFIGKKVSEVFAEVDSRCSIRTEDETHSYDHVILATPPFASSRLISNISALSDLKACLDQFDYTPICTVYLQYDENIRLDEAMLGMLGTVGQWIFDRRVCQQPGLMAVIISADGSHMDWDNDRLAQQIKSELAELFPHWPAPIAEFVIREKRATFNSRSGINAHRPSYKTAIENLWLAGDYTNTGYPATLEGAIRSGIQCAQQVIDSITQAIYLK